MNQEQQIEYVRGQINSAMIEADRVSGFTGLTCCGYPVALAIGAAHQNHHPGCTVMIVRYWVHGDEETEFNASAMDYPDNAADREIARKCAENYHDAGGWEVSWPVAFVLCFDRFFQDTKTSSSIRLTCMVDREAHPEFVPRFL